jgi:hypothetical protein
MLTSIRYRPVSPEPPTTPDSRVLASAPSALPQHRPACGISAVWNWIAAAGALNHHDMPPNQPCTLCYRVPAGSSCAMEVAPTVMDDTNLLAGWCAGPAPGNGMWRVKTDLRDQRCQTKTAPFHTLQEGNQTPVPSPPGRGSLIPHKHLFMHSAGAGRALPPVPCHQG